MLYLFCPYDFPGKNTGVGCHLLLQMIFPTQESNPSPALPTLAGRFFTTEPLWKAFPITRRSQKYISHCQTGERNEKEEFLKKHFLKRDATLIKMMQFKSQKTGFFLNLLEIIFYCCSTFLNFLLFTKIRCNHCKNQLIWKLREKVKEENMWPVLSSRLTFQPLFLHL